MVGGVASLLLLQWQLLISVMRDEAAAEALFQKMWSCKEVCVLLLYIFHVLIVWLPIKSLITIFMSIKVYVLIVCLLLLLLLLLLYKHSLSSNGAVAWLKALCMQAFIKARGDGLGFEPLSRVEVLFQGDAVMATTAVIAVDGTAQHRWRMMLHQLPNRHWVAVARGPPEAVVDAFGVRPVL
eukprot:jgi/Chrzof1/9198/Cz03g39160.t1